MKKIFLLPLLLILINVAIYSQAKTTKEIPKTYIVELNEVQFEDVDFSRSIFKAPLDIKIKIMENGKEIIPVDSAYTVIEGTRGERKPEHPLKWRINFKPENNYQIVVEEVGLLVDRKRYLMPQKLRTNYWPLKDNNGILYCGKESYVRFYVKEENP
ncbi:MAG TPA: hypothetical protein VFF33_00625 [Ignavibacteriaceae bacterium]|nr:hypothetical protein [Ignavibacteriaceae bacterium]